MAARYWGVELSNDRCDDILAQMNVPVFKGPDASQIVEAVEEVVGIAREDVSTSRETRLDDFITSGSITTTPTGGSHISLKQDFFHASRIESLKACFQVSRPIPQIVIYDDILASANEESPGGHASILHSLNFDSELVYLIDPNLQARKTPIYYTFDDFSRGWKSFEQATILLYPAGLYQTVRSLTSTKGLGEIS